MKGNGFKCPYCGSTHYEHIFPKDKTIPVFLRKCLRCGKFKQWIRKETRQALKEIEKCHI